MKLGMLKEAADKWAASVHYIYIDKTLEKHVTQRYYERNESQGTKDLRIELQQQVSLAEECTIEMGKDQEQDQEDEDQTDSHEDDCSVHAGY